MKVRNVRHTKIAKYPNVPDFTRWKIVRLSWKMFAVNKENLEEKHLNNGGADNFGEIRETFLTRILMRLSFGKRKHYVKEIAIKTD